MATVITAGNATNGLSLSADNTGAFEFKTGTGAGTTALSISSAQVVTLNGGVGGLVAGTAVTASGTSVNFTDIPSWVKRITVMFSGVSTNGTSAVIVQLGAGSVETTSYLATQGIIITTTPGTGGYTTGFPVGGVDVANIRSGQMIMTLLGSNAWISSAVIKGGTGTMAYSAGDKTLSGTLDRIRITTVNGTDTFDAGTINILYE